MAFTVKWNQWYRCGYDGDESDFEERSMSFATIEEAQRFVDKVVAGTFRGIYDRTVNRSEITIKEI